jgi:hypothetical protein
MSTKTWALGLANALDLANGWIGRTVAWLSLAMVLVTFLVVVLRYAFDTGSIAMQESVTYMHAVLFMIGAAYTLQLDGSCAGGHLLSALLAPRSCLGRPAGHAAAADCRSPVHSDLVLALRDRVLVHPRGLA